MKKMIAILLLMAFSISFASGAFAQVDLSTLTNEELKALQREISLKLCPAAQKGMLIWENEFVRVSFSSVKDMEWGDGIEIKLIIENKTEKELGIMCDSLTVNKWTVSTLGPGTVAANSNLMGEMEVFAPLSEYGINGIADINEITLALYVFDGKSYSTLEKSGTITLTF